MERDKPRERDLDGPLFAAGLVLLVLLGLGMRLQDPLSSPAMGAEDPYTHVVFAKEHMDRGYFADAWTLGTSLYPPGLHALAIILAPLGGVSLYDFARFAPAFLGTLGVAGVGVIARRFGGTSAGLVGALLAAVTPELVVRSNLFFPTTLDLALLPVFFLLFALTLERSWGAAVLLGGIGVVLAFSHPWIVPIACAAAGLAAFLGAVRERSWLDVARHVSVASLVCAPLVALSAVARWDQSNTGFSHFIADLGPLSGLATLPLGTAMLFVVITGTALLLAAPIVALATGLAALRPHLPRAVRATVGIALGLLLVFAAWGLGQTPPSRVYYMGAIGVAAIALAFVGLVIGLARPTRLSDIAVSLAVVTFPLTAIEIFGGVHDAQHWPARAVVYLALACALLGAVAAGFAAQEATRLLSARRSSRFAAPAAVVASILLVSGALAASPEDADPWYRLYSDEHFALFEELAERVESQPHTRVVVASWQPGLMLKALMDPNDVRYAPKFYNQSEKRDAILAEAPGWTVYVLVDHFLLERMAEPDSDIDLSFLDHGYREVESASDGKWRLYLREDSS